MRPGFTEIDLVSHSGDCADGEFLHSLNLTDIHTTWGETRAVMGKGERRVQEALETMRVALPFRLCGIDSDNGSEFINNHLYRYCQAHQMQFTRGRPYKKDDNAHIEQKNWTHVRKLVGYVRYDSAAALAALNALYDDLHHLVADSDGWVFRLEGRDGRAVSTGVIRDAEDVLDLLRRSTRPSPRRWRRGGRWTRRRGSGRCGDRASDARRPPPSSRPSLPWTDGSRTRPVGVGM